MGVPVLLWYFQAWLDRASGLLQAGKERYNAKPNQLDASTCLDTIHVLLVPFALSNDVQSVNNLAGRLQAALSDVKVCDLTSLLCCAGPLPMHAGAAQSAAQVRGGLPNRPTSVTLFRGVEAQRRGSTREGERSIRVLSVAGAAVKFPRNTPPPALLRTR
jgi:hypothetical protein